MKVLLNTTKTMDTSTASPGRLKCTQPVFASEAKALMAQLKRFSKPRLAREMALSPKLADETKAALAQWGEKGQTTAPALFAFTGLVYKHVEPTAWTAAQIRDAQKRLVILSGLYGALRPLDLIEAYRLEMGSKFKPSGSRNLLDFWRDRLTTALRESLKPKEPVLNLAAQEYTKVLDLKSLNRPVISPIFKETRPDGTLKTAPVYAKMARGAMVSFIFTERATKPADLLGFGAMGWEAATEPPDSGDWLFTRPVRT